MLGLTFSSRAVCAMDVSFLTRESDLRTDVENGQLAFGLEAAQIEPATGPALVGIGPRFGVDYDLGNGLSVNPAVSLVTSGTGFIYSGVSGFLRYSIFGELSSIRQVLSSNGVAIVTRERERSNRLSVGIGLEQLFLNGSQNVYPAAGISASVAYSMQLYGRRFEVSGRYSMLNANLKNLNAVFIDFSMLLGL